MSLVDALLDTAFQDTELLTTNDEKGDKFELPRDVEFILTTPEKDRAETVCSFITDNQYGEPKLSQDGGTYSIQVTINMPITQHVLCSVSALMVCLAELFDLDYEGWGCILQTGETAKSS